MVEVTAILQPPAAALVERERGINERSVIGDQPSHAVRDPGLLVGSQRHDHVAFRRPVLLLIPNEVRNPDGGHGLVVARSAAIEVAVLLGQDKGIERPVLPLRLDNVEMREQEQWPLACLARFRTTGAAQASDKVALPRRVGGNQHLDVITREARSLETRRHGPRSGGAVAGRLGCIGLDELLVNVASEAACRVIRRRNGGDEG